METVINIYPQHSEELNDIVSVKRLPQGRHPVRRSGDARYSHLSALSSLSGTRLPMETAEKTPGSGAAAPSSVPWPPP